MHRHSFQGRKLSRDTDQRRALVRGLVTSLVLYETIVTTEAKGKEIVPYFEKLVTTAKQGTLASRRSLSAFLLTENAARKLIEELLPALSDRNSGYTRLVKLPNRRGDNALMVQVSLVKKPVAIAEKAPKEAKKAATKPKATAKVAEGANNA